MAGKNWSPGAFQVGNRFLSWIENAIEGLISEQRALTDYEGPDDGWESHIAERGWEMADYQQIGYNSGYIRALLDVSYAGGGSSVQLPIEVERKAYLYIYD